MSSSQTFPAGSLTVRGHKIEIYTTDDGTWVAYPGDDRVEGPTRDKLKAALSRHLKAATLKVEVPFIGKDWRGRPPRRGVATALHSRNNTILVTWEDGSKDQLSAYSGGLTLSGDADLAEWNALADAVKAADKALADYQEANKIDLAEAVRNATSAAVDAAGDS